MRDSLRTPRCGQQTAPAVAIEIEPCGGLESDSLLPWLDGGLRGGRAGRLRGEYGPVLLAGGVDRCEHVVARLQPGGRPVAHALLRRVVASADGLSLPIGMVGLVYTEPEFRGRGLARNCIEKAVARLESRGAVLVALWSNLREFYARLGFHPAGSQRLHAIDAEICRRAAGSLGPSGRVRPVRAEDWGHLEALHGAKPTHIAREPGVLRHLAAAPECELYVSEWNGKPAAYVACGRGDDFVNVVHEWAGAGSGVLDCLAALLTQRGELLWMVGPHDEGPAQVLREAGARVLRSSFALLRLLDAERVWREATAEIPELARVAVDGGAELHIRSAVGEAQLDAAQSLRLLFGPGCPRTAAQALSPEQARALRARLPWPLFAWGFDSI